MPLRKVLADFGRGVWPSTGGKKNQQRTNPKFYRSSSPESSVTATGHIYYEPAEDFEWPAEAALLPPCHTQTGEVIVHRREGSEPAPISEEPPQDKPQNGTRAFTEEEFTSAILARKQSGSVTSASQFPDDEEVEATGQILESAAEMHSDKSGENPPVPYRESDEHAGEKQYLRTVPLNQRASDPAVSPVPERRNKGVLGRLKSFASRSSYTSEDGHSHSSDYEEQDEEKRMDLRFQRDAKERTSASWVRHLRKDVKKKISRLKNNRLMTNGEARECTENHDSQMHTGSSVESIPSGSGSSLQPPTPTSSNRSSTSAGEDDNSPYVGTFMGRARALVDYTPSPYDRDGLAFKKGDVIDIIAKHNTGIWVGMVQGRVGHFKFINVEEIGLEEWKPKHKRHRVSAHWLTGSNKPETLEQLLKMLALPEYMNVLVLNGYDDLDTFKEIEKEDLDILGITNPEHGTKLLRAAEILNGTEFDIDEDAEDQVRQSPRDSGCYASNENIAQQQNLNNGSHMEAEDVDTSHSESGIHSREGPDLTLPMNNLNLSEVFSEKSPDTATYDSRDDTLIVALDAGENVEGLPPNFNIPPTQPEVQQDEEIPKPDPPTLQESTMEESLESKSFFPVTSFADCISSRQGHSVLTNGNAISEICTSSSSSHQNGCKPSKAHRSKQNCRKSKDKECSHHHRHHHRSLSKDSDWSPYVYGWTSFSKKKDKHNGRRRVQEYDDVVSDPAIDPELSPGRHVYKKTKQRKGSLQELIRHPLPPSTSLLSLVKLKLESENINLFEEPYTDKTGFCGIPPALVQRYAEELKQNLTEVAGALDQIRIASLQQHARRGVPNDFLADSCTIPVIVANYSSLHAWLISLGLPMYEANFLTYNYANLEDVATLTPTDLTTLGIQEHRHQRFLASSVRALRTRVGERYLNNTSVSPDDSSVFLAPVS